MNKLRSFLLQKRKSTRKIVLTIGLVSGITFAAVIFGHYGILFGEKYTANNGDTPMDFSDIKASDNRQVLLCMGESPDTMYVSWKGNERGPKYFRYSTDRYGLPTGSVRIAEKQQILKGDYYRYTVKLEGIRQGQIYYYEIGDGVAFDSPKFFYGPEEDGEDVFAYFADPQFDMSVAEYKEWESLTWEMYENVPDVEFALLGGDMVNVPTREEQWNSFLDSCGVFSMVPVMAVPGNHEGVSSNNTYKKLFHRTNNGPSTEAFYYFDYGNCRFIMMDSSFLTAARQLKMGMQRWQQQAEAVELWLANTLDQSPKQWNIVVMHHPAYGMHDVFTTSADVRKSWLPIMEEGGVDMVLCGHQHVYMRTREIDGILHVMGVSGGKKSRYYRGFNAPKYSEALYGGGPNYQIIRATDKALELTSYSKNGRIVDAVRLEKSVGERIKSIW